MARSLFFVFVLNDDIFAFFQTDDLNCLNGVHRLSLNKCLINNWGSIERLADINTLQDLRIIAIPLWEQYANDEHFHLVIGRIPQLKILNGSVISAEQREQSERFLIRLCSFVLVLLNSFKFTASPEIQRINV